MTPERIVYPLCSAPNQPDEQSVKKTSKSTNEIINLAAE
jgi:hypothetical protein